MPPTVVTLCAARQRMNHERGRIRKFAYNGQLAGKPGINLVWLLPSFVKQICDAGSGLPSPTPLSPEANNSETPRAPINRLQDTKRREERAGNQVGQTLRTHGVRNPKGLYVKRR